MSATIQERPVAALKPYARNARTHSKRQIRQLADSIRRFGFTNPVLVSDAGEIVCGHGRVEAAKLLGMATVPTIALSHLSEAERCAYVLADNKLALEAGCDQALLAVELQALIDLDFDLTLTGFSLAEIDLVLDQASESDPVTSPGTEDRIVAPAGQAVSRPGDLWQLGRHRLICGDAREPQSYQALLGDERVDIPAEDDGEQSVIDAAAVAASPDTPPLTISLTVDGVEYVMTVDQIVAAFGGAVEPGPESSRRLLPPALATTTLDALLQRAEAQHERELARARAHQPTGNTITVDDVIARMQLLEDEC